MLEFLSCALNHPLVKLWTKLALGPSVTFSVSLRRLVNGGGSQSGSFPFILNDKCHYPPGPHWVWRSDVTTVRKSLVLVGHDSEEEIDPAFREVRERNG